MTKKILFSLLFFSPELSHAASADLSPTQIGSITEEDFRHFGRWIMVGTHLHSPATAVALSWPKGLDAGILLTQIHVDRQVQRSMKELGVEEGIIPGDIKLPRFYLAKGLPGNSEIGASFLEYDQFKIWGLTGKWNFLSLDLGHRLRWLTSARGTYSQSKVFGYIDTRSGGTDLLTTLELADWVEVYGGTGGAYGKSHVQLPISIPTPISLDLDSEQFFFSSFIGASFNGKICKLRGEYFFKSPVKINFMFSLSF